MRTAIRITAALFLAILLSCRLSGANVSAETIVWQTGNGRLGSYKPDVSGCASSEVTTVFSGHDVSFTIRRNTKARYTYKGNTFPGASTCYRNQIDPVDPTTGTNFLLAIGARYTFTFETVVTFNGNYVFEHPPGGRLAIDVPAIVWQTHSYGGGGSPCDLLVIQNTARASGEGVAYAKVPRGGRPTWNFHTCDETDFTGNAYNSPDALHDGEVDAWQIDVVPQIQGRNGGSVSVRRNGKIVYTAPSHVCDASTPECFWNFGPYMFFWATSEEPSEWNEAGVTVRFKNMTLVKH